MRTLTKQSLAWLSDAQFELLRTLAVFVLVCVADSGLKQTGALATLLPYRRLCEAIGLLPLTDASMAWHTMPLACSAGMGGALLILSPPRRPRWIKLPHIITVVPAVMGGKLPSDVIDTCNSAARRMLTRGEIGILHSNSLAWQRALDAGWEWGLVLEDDAQFGNGREEAASLHLFLARLPALIEAASAMDPDWQLLVLTPVNTPYDFFKGTPAESIPTLLSSKQLRRHPEFLPPSKQRAAVAMPPCWQRCPPTYHAFGWVYRAPLMASLVEGFRERQPPLEPLDIWVWELMAVHGVLDRALCLATPLVDGSAGSAGKISSIKDAQDDPRELNKIYSSRGYGT